ncbi:hypothetical protein [Paraferrimonas haliotis]|nr:hypothetical protein [Paraferrimonas haliotis]
MTNPLQGAWANSSFKELVLSSTFINLLSLALPLCQKRLRVRVLGIVL